jgi:hypothetical protein
MLASVCCAVAVVAAAGAASAAEYSPLFPTPAVGSAVVGFDHHKGEAKKAEPIKLFECVKVRDCDHKAPCGETKIVKVLDPCWKPDPCACCQKPSCVYVAVCVPKKQCCPKPCCAPKPSCCAPAPCQKTCCKPHGKTICKDGGRYVKLDYGKYRVEIRVKKGYVEVDYDN